MILRFSRLRKLGRPESLTGGGDSGDQRTLMEAFKEKEEAVSSDCERCWRLWGGGNTSEALRWRWFTDSDVDRGTP